MFGLAVASNSVKAKVRDREINRVSDRVRVRIRMNVRFRVRVMVINKVTVRVR